MSIDPTKFSIVDLSALAEPATRLIDKVSDAVGGIAKPFQIVRVARAEADAELIRAKARIQVMELEERALNRFVAEETKKQVNIESITAKALPEVTDEADPELMEDDWITNFFDKSRLISDEDMQTLWACILAGEANSPGTYSKRTVDLLASLDKRDAELFRSLCGFAFHIGDITPLIYDVEANIYNEHGVDFNSASHLDSLGLVHFGAIGGYVKRGFPEEGYVHYYGEPIWIGFEGAGPNDLKVGNVLLTQAGQQLAPISGSRPVEGFVDYVRERWRSFGHKVDPSVSQTPSGEPRAREESEESDS